MEGGEDKAQSNILTILKTAPIERGLQPSSYHMSSGLLQGTWIQLRDHNFFFLL